MKRILLILWLLNSLLASFAQSSCASVDYRRAMLKLNPELNGKMDEIEAFTRNIQNYRSSTTNGLKPIAAPALTNIPVVVHILYNTSAQDISDAQVLSQIAVLNRDYTRQNADTGNAAPVFRQVAANCGFHFELAKVDTNGIATSGIVRKRTSVVAFGIDDGIKFSSMGGDDAWDRDKYLNIWVGNLENSVLGYSSVVGGPAANDGVVILYSAFGEGGSAAAPFNLGRTATHEIGHWLNLIHTWGDADCGNDLVADTPPQETADYGSPTGVKISCNNAPYGDMYTNFMDFTNDNTMNLFTNGQNARMHALFAPGGPRYALLFSNVLNSTALSQTDTAAVHTDASANRDILLFPNPATSMVTVQIPDNYPLGATLEVYNQVGQKMMSTFVDQPQMELNVSLLARGVYFVKLREGGRGSISRLVKL